MCAAIIDPTQHRVYFVGNDDTDGAGKIPFMPSFFLGTSDIAIPLGLLRQLRQVVADIPDPSCGAPDDRQAWWPCCRGCPLGWRVSANSLNTIGIQIHRDDCLENDSPYSSTSREFRSCDKALAGFPRENGGDHALKSNPCLLITGCASSITSLLGFHQSKGIRAPAAFVAGRLKSILVALRNRSITWLATKSPVNPLSPLLASLMIA